MIPEDRPTLPERYSRAMSSPNLKWGKLHERTVDLDILIAFGWIKQESLGTSLYRLRTEFDAINKIEVARCGSSLVARVLTLSQLRALPDVRNALGRFSIAHATRQRFMRPDDRVLQIAGRALDLWLDPHCPTCTGRGFTGGYGAPIVLCSHCHGSGKRTVDLDREYAGHEFGRSILAAMDRKTDFVRSQMKRHLSRTEGKS